jgi:hypothetical protein
MIIANPVLNRNQGESQIDFSEKFLVWLSDWPSMPISEATSKLTPLSEI